VGTPRGESLVNFRRGVMLKVRTHTTARLDDKGRLSLPSKLRAALDVHRVGSLVLLSVRGALWAWTPEDFERIEARLDGVDPFAADSLDFTHGVLATADELDVDRSGRIRIPTDLQEMAGLSREVKVISVLDRVEIWDPQRWRERHEVARAASEAAGGMPAPPVRPAEEGA